jgi:hypothetical protein
MKFSVPLRIALAAYYIPFLVGGQLFVDCVSIRHLPSVVAGP